MAGTGVLGTLKMKMQVLRDDLEKARDEIDTKDAELAKERELKQQVGVWLFLWIFQESYSIYNY